MKDSSIQTVFEFSALKQSEFLYKKLWANKIAVLALIFFIYVLYSADISAQDQNVYIKSIDIISQSSEYAEVELQGSYDGKMGDLWLGIIAKSRDGTVRSIRYSPYIIPVDNSFRVRLQVLRPYGVSAQKTDVLMVMVYPARKEIIKFQKFDGICVWPEKAADTQSISGEQSDLMAEKSWRVFDENLSEEEFGVLDELIDHSSSSQVRDKNGNWILDGFRGALVYRLSRTKIWKDELNRIQKWRRLNPKSAGAAIAEAKYWAAYAWHIRGDESFSHPDPVAIKVFNERLKRAQEILLASKPYASSNPLWYEAYLDIAGAVGRDEKFIENLFNEAVARHTYFQPIYLAMAKYWAPRSGINSNWDKADAVIRQAVKNTKEMDGLGNYASLYVRLGWLQKQDYDTFVEHSRISWGRMRESFVDLLKRYPGSANLNSFAAYACWANDKEAYLNIRPSIINRVLPEYWRNAYSYDLCDIRFMEKS